MDSEKTMNGTIFNELDKFGQATLGKEEWDRLIHSANLPRRTHLAVKNYPDSEFLTLIAALAAKKDGGSAETTLEAFGVFIAPDFIKMAQHFIDPSWKTIDLIANTQCVFAKESFAATE